VSEFTHDTADEGFHEIQLSGKQLVFLFIVTTTVIVVVFLCGVKVGRGARAAQGEEPDPVGVAATASPATAQPSSDSAAPPAEPPAPADEAPPKLDYPGLLKSGSPEPDSKLKPQPDTSPAVEPPPPARRPERAAEPSRPGPAAESAGVPNSGRAGTWAVQVIATRDRNIATTIVKRLVAKDYPAFLVNPAAGGGPAYYKVHVGRFNDRGEAEQVSERIKKEEQFQSWITR
jgi:cell division septation protein DedD